MTKKQLDNDQCKELCLKLLRAETEKEVEQILKQYKIWGYKDFLVNEIKKDQQVLMLTEALTSSIDAFKDISGKPLKKKQELKK